MIASLPSPSFNSIGIGPLNLNIYGLAIALGVVTAMWMLGRRFVDRGVGTPDDASAIAIWAVGAGVVGARLYHVATDWERFEGNYSAIPKLWEGGLGIPGGLLFGIPVGLYLARRQGIPIAVAATCAAPCIPAAQVIGRFGNYFNQELYGRPTDLPWALEIDAEHLVRNPATDRLFEVGTTFHPTFLYEALWSLGVVVFLLVVDRRRADGEHPPANGSLMGLYVAAYGVGRFWVEGLRVDPADEIGPFRLNQWVAIAAVVVGLTAWALLRDRPQPVLVDGAGRDGGDDGDDLDGVDGDDADRVDGDGVDGDGVDGEGGGRGPGEGEVDRSGVVSVPDRLPEVDDEN